MDSQCKSNVSRLWPTRETKDGKSTFLGVFFSPVARGNSKDDD